MLESIKEHVMNHFSENNLFCSSQHGFQLGHSCVTKLLNVMEDRTSTLEMGYSVDIVYLHFQKAFDRVPHRRLLLKQSSYGINHIFLNWIKDFFNCRRQ